MKSHGLLKKYLDNKNCTKLILGANNENCIQITNLVALYSKAGCVFFDVNATKNSIIAAKKGLEYSNKKDCLLCISVGVYNDMHFKKCKKCKKCTKLCPQKAISNNLIIDEKKCTGCTLCAKSCPNEAIEIYQKINSWQENFNELKNLCDCVEFHIMSSNKEEIFDKWNFLCKNYNSFLSISVNRSIFSDKELIILLKAMLDKRPENLTIIQADGIPLSGNDNSTRTTLQAVAMADFIDKSNLGAYIHVSGGVNTKTRKLLDKFKININGISIGSYARNAVKDYVLCEDFLENEKKFNKALKIAKKIINSTKN